MPYQLVFTSAAELLEGASPGYGIVACSEGIPCGLRCAVVSISELKEPAGKGILGPQFSYHILRVGGQAYHTLSAIQPGGADYSGRDCIIAHHLILPQHEVDRVQRHAAKLTPAGIMHALASHGFWLPRWEEHPHYIHQDPPLSVADLPDAEGQPTWKKLTGSQREIQAFNAQPYDRECLAVVPEGIQSADILLLLHESDCLSPACGWGHTFCSYAAPEDSFAETQRLFTVAGSPIEQSVRRSGRPCMIISPASFLAACGASSSERDLSNASAYKYEQPDDADTYNLPPRRLTLRLGLLLLLLLGGALWGCLYSLDSASEKESKAENSRLHSVNAPQEPSFHREHRKFIINRLPDSFFFSASVSSFTGSARDRGKQPAASAPEAPEAPEKTKLPKEEPRFTFAPHLCAVLEGAPLPQELSASLEQQSVTVHCGSVTIVPAAMDKTADVFPLSPEDCSLVWKKEEANLYTATIQDAKGKPLHTISLELDKNGALQKIREGKRTVIAALPAPADGKNYTLRSMIFSPTVIVPGNGHTQGIPLPPAIAQAAVALSPAALELSGHQAARKLSLKRAFKETFPWAPYKEQHPFRLSIRLPRVDGPNAVQLIGEGTPPAPSCEVEYASIDARSDTIVISLERTFDISETMMKCFNREANGSGNRFYSLATLYALMEQMDSARKRGELIKLCEQYALLFENPAFASLLNTVLDKIPVAKPNLKNIPAPKIRQAAKNFAPLAANGLGNKKNRQKIKEAICRQLNRILYPVLENNIRKLEQENSWFLQLSDITELTPDGGLLWKFTLHRSKIPEKASRSQP